MANFFTKSKVTAVEWPRNPTNFDPIEKLLTEINDKDAENQLPSANDVTRGAIKEIWVEELSKECCKSLIHSMTRRIEGNGLES